MEDHLETVRQRIVPSGSTLLSKQWGGWHVHYRFRCAQGHEWTRTAASVVYQSRLACPDCLNNERLARIKDAAKAHGGECVEHTYLGDTPHRFICAHGHHWSALPSRVLAGRWCSRCLLDGKGRQREREGLERLHTLAREQGGQCLAQRYTHRKARYRFRCASGHEWLAIGADIFRGHWCTQCVNIASSKQQRFQDGLARLQAAAEARGGQCLSEAYVNSQKTHYRFRCAQGHEWEAIGQSIFRGSWCSKCARQARKIGIERMQALAEARGGRCLSDTYRTCQDTLQWQCHAGHTWWTKAITVMRGCWCPHCANINLIRSPNSKAWRKYQKAGHLSLED